MLRFLGYFIAVWLIVLAAWQFGQQEVWWALSDMVFAAWLLNLLARSRP